MVFFTVFTIIYRLLLSTSMILPLYTFNYIIHMIITIKSTPLKTIFEVGFIPAITSIAVRSAEVLCSTASTPSRMAWSLGSVMPEGLGLHPLKKRGT